MNNYWKTWTQKAGIRAIRTMAQTFIATVGSSTLLSEVDWKIVLSSTILSGILCIALSIKGLPEIEAEKGEKQNE